AAGGKATEPIVDPFRAEDVEAPEEEIPAIPEIEVPDEPPVKAPAKSPAKIPAKPAAKTSTKFAEPEPLTITEPEADELPKMQAPRVKRQIGETAPPRLDQNDDPQLKLDSLEDVPDLPSRPRPTLKNPPLG